LKTRDIFIIGPLLAVCVLCYFFGYRQGWRAEKRADTEFNIKRALRVLRYAEGGDTTNIIKSTRMFLLGHTRTYDSLVPDHDVPESFRATLADARRISQQVQSNLVTFDPRSLDQ
jgi:hypothetical protein